MKRKSFARSDDDGVGESLSNEGTRRVASSTLRRNHHLHKAPYSFSQMASSSKGKAPAKPITDAYLKELQENEKKAQNGTKSGENEESEEKTSFKEVDAVVDEAEASKDTPDVPPRPSEKKRLHWKGLTCEQPFPASTSAWCINAFVS